MRPSSTPAVGKVSSSILPGFQLRQTRSKAVDPLLVQRTVPGWDSWDSEHCRYIYSQDLRVWALSPLAPQMLQTNFRRTGQVTTRPSRVFKLWELDKIIQPSSKVHSILGGEEVTFKIAAQSSFDKNITCRILQARHCGSRDCSASLLFRSWWGRGNNSRGRRWWR